MARPITHRLLPGLVTAMISASAGVLAQFDAADSDPGRFLIDSRIALIQGQTLADWRTSHPRDSIELYDGRLSHVENWCVRATLDTPGGSGRTATRVAYFFPPDDTHDRLPGGSPAELRDACRLGLIWTEIPNSDVPDATRTVDSLRRSIASSVGAGRDDVRPTWYGTASWRDTTFWRLGAVTLVTARRSDGAQPALFAFVAAAGPAAHTDFQSFQYLDDMRDDLVSRWRETAARLREGIRLASVPGPAGDSVRSSVELVDSYTPPMLFPPAAERLDVLNAIDRWLTASANLPAPRRAAALFVADQLLTASGTPEWAENDNPPIRRRLEAQGASFSWDELGASYAYTHTWLKEARRLDPDGRAGDLAYVALMEMGFETSGKCTDQGGEGFRAVVREGDAYLRGHPRSPIAPEVHLLMAAAYSDIVALANGLGYDGTDGAKRYLPESDAARANAIAQFRFALDATPQPPRAPLMWSTAWRLLAEVPPTRTYFYCIYD